MNSVEGGVARLSDSGVGHSSCGLSRELFRVRSGGAQSGGSEEPSCSIAPMHTNSLASPSVLGSRSLSIPKAPALVLGLVKGSGGFWRGGKKDRSLGLPPVWLQPALGLTWPQSGFSNFFSNEPFLHVTFQMKHQSRKRDKAGGTVSVHTHPCHCLRGPQGSRSKSDVFLAQISYD